jgi:hypothetical protein
VNYKVEELFKCDCMSEGITVTPLEDTEDISEGEVIVEVDKELKDRTGSPFIQLSFWEFGHKTEGRWSWWWRLKIAWHIFRTGKPWADMIIMKASVAKKLANHILYVIRKVEEEKKVVEQQVEEQLDGKEGE